MNRLRT